MDHDEVRVLKRIHLVAAAVSAIAALISGSAIAFAGWCASDPIIGITAPGMREQDLQIWVGMDDENIPLLRGPVIVTVTVPANVRARVKFMDDIIPEKVVIRRTNPDWDGGPVVVDASVRAHSRATFPVTAEVIYDGPGGEEVRVLVEGTSNQDLSHTARMRGKR